MMSVQWSQSRSGERSGKRHTDCTIPSLMFCLIQSSVCRFHKDVELLVVFLHARNYADDPKAYRNKG
jgi:hypothetical protein